MDGLKICNSRLTDHIDYRWGIATEKEIMPRIASLQVIERQIRELEAKAEALKHQEKPGLKQLKALVAKYRLTPSDVELAMNGHGRRSRGSKLAGRKLRVVTLRIGVVHGSQVRLLVTLRAYGRKLPVALQFTRR